MDIWKNREHVSRKRWHHKNRVRPNNKRNDQPVQPIQRLHLLEEYRESLPSQQLPSVHEEIHNAEEQPQSIREKNGSMPLVGEDVQIQERRSRYGRLIKPVKR